MKIQYVLLAALFVVFNVKSQEYELNLDSFFTEDPSSLATFVVLEQQTKQMSIYNKKRANEQFIPASTFKIPHSLIALDTGVLSGPEHIKVYDPSFKTKDGFWADAWSQDQTLGTAIKFSAYWYFQQVARSIGPAKMKQYLSEFSYGNQSIDGGIDKFWLHGALRISAIEQVNFLYKMYNEQLGISGAVFQQIKPLLVLQRSETTVISGKTGTADLTPSRELAWLVGYVEHKEKVWFYALNVEGEKVWEIWGKPTARLNLVKKLLAHMNVPIPSDEGMGIAQIIK